jgi:Lrp/AsnC family transcriptional regulator, leucine-responsive regulatory protein
MRYIQARDVKNIPKLDKKDEKLLSLLALNARETGARIAKRTGLSKDAVLYRQRKLEAAGIVQGYTALIDISKMGWSTYHLFIKLNQLDAGVQQLVVESFKRYPFVKALVEFSGKFSFEIALAASSLGELDSFISQIVDDLSDVLHEYIIQIITKGFVSKGLPGRNIEVQRPKPMNRLAGAVKMDDKNRQILFELSRNARLSLHKLGAKAGLTAEGVKYRLKKLCESGVILGYLPIFNYQALGYTVYTVLMGIKNLTTLKEKRLESFLQNSPHVLWGVKSIGRYNLMMYVCTRKSEEFHATMTELRSLFAADIEDYEALIASEEYIYTYFPQICLGLPELA